MRVNYIAKHQVNTFVEKEIMSLEIILISKKLIVNSIMVMKSWYGV
jgi:hypothetical protein